MISIYSKRYLLGKKNNYTPKLEAVKWFYKGNGYEIVKRNNQQVYHLSTNYSARRAANNSFNIKIVHALDGNVYLRAATSALHFYTVLTLVILVIILTVIFDWVRQDDFNTFLKHNILTNVVAWSYFIIGGKINLAFVNKDLKKILNP